MPFQQLLYSELSQIIVFKRLSNQQLRFLERKCLHCLSNYSGCDKYMYTNIKMSKKTIPLYFLICSGSMHKLVQCNQFAAKQWKKKTNYGWKILCEHELQVGMALYKVQKQDKDETRQRWNTIPENYSTLVA